MSITLCPYILKPLAVLTDTNREHVIPDGLGGVNAFSVKADTNTNSRLGHTLDIDFMNVPIVKMIAAQQGIVTRNGPITLPFTGEVEGSGEHVQGSFSNQGMEVQFRNPVDKDPDTGEVVGIHGWGDQAKKFLEEMNKNRLKKGKPAFQPGKPATRAKSTIRIGFQNDLGAVVRGLAKIAYLSEAYVFGDGFINSTAGDIFRQAYQVKEIDELEKLGINGGYMKHNIFPFEPVISESQHLVVALRTNDAYVVTVRLFNNDLLTSTFCVKHHETLQQEPAGEIIIVDTATSCFSRETLIDYIVRYLHEQNSHQ